MSKLRHLVLSGVIAISAAHPALASQITNVLDPALTGSTVIDFNSEPTHQFLAQTFSGVTFTAAAGGYMLAIEDESVGGDYGGTGQVLSTVSSNVSFAITFGAPVSAFGMIWGGANENWTVQLFDSSHALLETLTFGQGAPDYIDFYGATTAGIRHVTLVAQNADWVKIDDFRFVPESTTSVPEPGTGPLLASLLGLAGAVWGWRRRVS